MLDEDKPVTKKELDLRLESLEADVRRLARIVDSLNEGAGIYSIDRTSVIIPKRLAI